jgi:acetyl-CoA C-acetyltransferase
VKLSTNPVIVSAVRTPMGSFNGLFRSVSATQLGSRSIAAALQRINLSPASVDVVYMGCVLSAGLGQAPARQASIGAAIPQSVGAVTVNKVCGLRWVKRRSSSREEWKT